MSKALEIMAIGVRNAKPAELRNIPDGTDPLVVLAGYLEQRWTEGALIVASHGNKDTFGVCPRPVMPWHTSVLRVRIVDFSEMDTAEVEAVRPEELQAS